MSTFQVRPCKGVRIPATSYLIPLFTLIYVVLFHLLPPYYLDVPCYLNNRQRYCSVWSERKELFIEGVNWSQVMMEMKGKHTVHSNVIQAQPLVSFANAYVLSNFKYVELLLLCFITADSNCDDFVTHLEFALNV